MIEIPTLLIRFALPALLGIAIVVGSSSVARAADPISEQDAHSIGVTAYLYFYPLGNLCTSVSVGGINN